MQIDENWKPLILMNKEYLERKKTLPSIIISPSYKHLFSGVDGNPLTALAHELMELDISLNQLHVNVHFVPSHFFRR